MPRRAADLADLDRDALLDEEQDAERLIVALPMPIARARDADRDRLLSLLKERVPDPSIFEDREPFLWQMAASNTNLDSYYTSMHRSTLTNFAEDANTGVSFQNSHRWFELPFGKTLRGQFREKRGESPTRALIDGYTLPGLNLNGINTDELIAGMRAGIVSDVSVGFYGGRTICDLCGGNYEDYRECPHWLGFEHEDEKTGEKITATATIHDAHLSEVSAVYDGATPGAGVVKVYRAMDAGEFPDDLLRRAGSWHNLLDQASDRYRVNVRSRRHFPSGWRSGDEETRMGDMREKNGTPPADVGILQAWQRAVEAALADAGHPEAEGRAEPATVIRGLYAELVELRPLREKVAEQERQIALLTPKAKDGETYRDTLRKQVEENYVRAKGERANVAAKAPAWDSGSIEFLVAEIAEYSAEGDALFGRGRITTEGEPEERYRRPGPPPSAFRA